MTTPLHPAIKKIKAAIKAKQKERYRHEDRGNFRSAELAEFHENCLQEVLDILEGNDKVEPKVVVRRKKKPVVPKVDPTVWTKADRTTIKIKDMDDKHLVNTIRMLKRHAHSKVTAFTLTENPFHGEIAMESFDSAQTAALENPEEEVDRILEGIPQFKHLVAEAKQRGLKA